MYDKVFRNLFCFLILLLLFNNNISAQDLVWTNSGNGWSHWNISSSSGKVTSYRFKRVDSDKIQIMHQGYSATPEFTYYFTNDEKDTGHIKALDFDLTDDGVTEFIIANNKIDQPSLDTALGRNIFRIYDIVAGSTLIEFNETSYSFDLDKIIIADVDNDGQLELSVRKRDIVNSNKIIDVYSLDIPVSYIETQKSNSPKTFKLNQNFPNPFNPQTKISFNLHDNGEVKLSIYDVQGRILKRLIHNEYRIAGNHEVVWNGRNEFGNPVGSGAYFYSLQVNGKERISKKMLLLK